MRQEGEPSVEEILESIKKVIARDEARAAAPQPQKRRSLVASPEDLADSDHAGEVLDLGLIGAPLQDDEEALIESEAEAEAGVAGLTTDRAADAMRQSLAALAMLAEPPARPQIVRQGETSLEGMVREMLRPMLAQWLDANLPEIVERLVKAEIARIAGKKR
jgi:hypothetical protein